MRADSFARYANAQGPNIPDRCQPLLGRTNDRLASGTWPFERTQISRTATEGAYRAWDGRVHRGVNFLAQDYLGLSQDERVLDVVRGALSAYGLHGAGSELTGGTTPVVADLASRLGNLFGRKHCIVFSTGWAAGYATLRGLMRRHDHIVIDRLAHSCLSEGARASGATVTPFDRTDLDALERVLRTIRAGDAKAAILVVAESLSPAESDGPDLREVVRLAREHAAYVLLDSAHDFGLFGPRGAGLAAEAGVLAEVDFLVGSFSKVLATTGGFMASRWRQCTLAVQAFGEANTFGDQLGPLQAAAALAALEISMSEDGDRLRAEVLAASAALRQALEAQGLECPGRASAIVPVRIGADEAGREIAKRLAEGGILVDAANYPAAAPRSSHLRLHLTPRHGELDLARIASAVAAVVRDCTARARRSA